MSAPERVWREVVWPRPFRPETAVDLLDRLGADRRMGEVVFETRAQAGLVRTLVAVHPTHLRDLTVLIGGLANGSRVVPVKTTLRSPVTMAGHLTASHPTLALNVERVTAVTRAVLAGLSAAGTEEEVVLQVTLGGRIGPGFLAQKVTDPTETWFDLLLNGAVPASADQRASLKTRRSLHGFRTIIRIGATAKDQNRSRGLIAGVLSGLRVAESAGVHFRFHPENPIKLSEARRPWRYPLELSSRELVSLMGWPIGTDSDDHLPGHPGAHPRQIPAPDSVKPSPRPFAVTTAAGEPVRIGITARDSLQHTLLLGPTGSGKSVTILAMVEDAMRAGRGLLLIDPKTDLVNDVLSRVPQDRVGDVVVIDPTSPRPVGINPLDGDGRSAELRADSILAVFKDLFADSWGPRTQDVLTSALITLAHHKGATLTMLPALLTDDRFRATLTRGLTDRLGLGTFWGSYEAMSPEQRAQVIAPVMNKLRQFLLRPTLRAVLGQSEPGFTLGDLFTKRRIVLVSLNKGIIGAESARLLGALIVSQLWPLTLGRAALPPERRHIVNVFIDEVQDYLALPTDLEDAFAQARGLGVGFTVAHQYRRQLPASLRAGLDANARNKIVFGLNADDAGDLAKQAVGLDAQDFMLLPRYGIYTTLQVDGHSTGWFSARTLPPSATTSDPVGLRAQSAETYGRDAHEVEREVLHAIGLDPEDGPGQDLDEPIGRRQPTDRRPS